MSVKKQFVIFGILTGFQSVYANIDLNKQVAPESTQVTELKQEAEPAQPGISISTLNKVFSAWDEIAKLEASSEYKSAPNSDFSSTLIQMDLHYFPAHLKYWEFALSSKIRKLPEAVLELLETHVKALEEASNRIGKLKKSQTDPAVLKYVHEKATSLEAPLISLIKDPSCAEFMGKDLQDRIQGLSSLRNPIHHEVKHRNPEPS